MKKIIILFEIVCLSFLNMFYKYITVQNYRNIYNHNSSIIGSYTISSNSEISYFNIFIFSLIFTFCLFLIILFILKKGNSLSLFDTINKFSNYYLVIILILSGFVLNFSILLFCVGIIIFSFVFLLFLFKNFNNKKINCVVSLIYIFNILILYYISL